MSAACLILITLNRVGADQMRFLITKARTPFPEQDSEEAFAEIWLMAQTD